MDSLEAPPVISTAVWRAMEANPYTSAATLTLGESTPPWLCVCVRVCTLGNVCVCYDYHKRNYIGEGGGVCDFYSFLPKI